MFLPVYMPVDHAYLVAAVTTVHRVAPAKERIEELATAAETYGLRHNIDPIWLATVCIGETPTLRPNMHGGGVCQVVNSKARTITRSVADAAALYSKIVQKHGRRNAHLFYGCGNSRCGGVWSRPARWKMRTYYKLKRLINKYYDCEAFEQVQSPKCSYGLSVVARKD